MSQKKLKLGALIAAALLVCSCSTHEPLVIDHNIDRPDFAETFSTVHTQPFPAAPEDTLPADDNTTGEITAVHLPETTTVADALPPEDSITEIMAAQSEPAATAPAAANAAVSINSSLLALSSAQKKYTYEKQKTNGNMTVLGPNLVYVGESFDYSCYAPGAGNAHITWNVIGSGGKIDKNGTFTAKEKCVCTVVATDSETGVYAALRVHCIENEDDVDFIPLVNNIPIANKTYPLPKDYDPGLDPNARTAFLRLQSDAAAAGLTIYPISAYRSYSYQKQVYAGWVSMYGDEADLISARPGHSEHQLGLAIDVNSAEYSFADTAESKWLREHCAEYGFILRYPDFESRYSTGYSYEPWHIRYIGIATAKAVMESGMSLEQLLHIDSYYR